MRLFATIRTVSKIFVLALLLVGGYIWFKPICEEKRRLERIRDEYQSDNDQMTEEINELKQNQVMFSVDPDFVEQVARKANRIRPNETVFVFPPSDAP